MKIKFTYDSELNLISFDSQEINANLSYDPLNRLIQLKTQNSKLKTINYTYCPLGKRIAKDNSIFLYDDQDLIAEYDPEGTLNARYTFGPGIDNPISVRIGTQSHFYHLDGLGSVIAITDSNKNIVSSYSYDAFGGPFISSSIPNPFLFTSREYELKSNLYYYRARYYDPEVGRFMNVDPIFYLQIQPGRCSECILEQSENLDLEAILEVAKYLPETLHSYIYCQNNPVNFIDPAGLRISEKCYWKCVRDFAIGGGIIGGIGGALLTPTIPLFGGSGGALIGGVAGGLLGKWVCRYICEYEPPPKCEPKPPTPTPQQPGGTPTIGFPPPQGGSK